MSTCIGLHGKIYLVDAWTPRGAIRGAYVFDLAGQRHWQKCAAMEKLNDCYSLEYGVLGKIYAIGGCGRKFLVTDKAL